MDQSGQNGLIMTKMDQIGPKWTKWAEQGQCGLNRNKVDRMDRIGLSEMNRTKVDRIGSKWTKVHQSGQNRPNGTNVDQIESKQTE